VLTVVRLEPQYEIRRSENKELEEEKKEGERAFTRQMKLKYEIKRPKREGIK
jgi:hypothetical protein